ncbi:MAG: LptA/OstA family protein [Caulobacteraceae bacterium]|nr:LptA/OstA family protein [Caulobacteraceae bacterium]
MNRPAALSTFPSLAVALALALAAPGAAPAQIAPAGHGPVDVTADQLEVQQGQCLANWSGNAEALQDNSRLRADSLKIYNRQLGGGSGGQSCGALDRMEADGQVYYVTPTQVVKADHAVYTAADTTIVMTGDVVAAQGKNVTAGSRLVINTNTGVATMATGVTGRGAKGRVRGVFFPDQNASGSTAGGPQAPVPPPPRRHPQS